MSERHRTVAGSPRRSASETAGLLLGLIRDTLAPAKALDHDVVVSEMEGARAAVRRLVVGAHLEVEPMVLDAPPLRLNLSVISGVKAIDFTENLGTVAGAAMATEWLLHLPAPAPITAWISADLEDLDHVTPEPAGELKAAAAEGALAATDIDLGALRRVGGGA